MKKSIGAMILALSLPLGVYGAPIEESLRRTEPIIKPISQVRLKIDLKGKNIFKEGKRLASIPCYIENNTSYVSLKTIVQELYNGNIHYNKQTGEVKVQVEGLTFQIKVGEKVGIKNGESVSILQPLVFDKGAIYCPMKSLQDLMAISIVHVSDAQVVSLTAPDRYIPEIINVFSSFYLEETQYIKGQSINVHKDCYDITGQKIVAMEWMLDYRLDSVTSDFNKLMENLTVGGHTLSLRAKNNKGQWSEWASQRFSIISNKKPEVTQIISNKESYKQGEKIELTYEYHNEEWEEIVEEKWSYKRVSDEEKQRLMVKPDYIFYKGDYEISLQLKDAVGNWSEPFVYPIHISEEMMDTEFNFRFKKNEPGSIINNFEEVNYREEFEEVILKPLGREEGTYLLSDSPENVYQNGILYEDIIEGKGRINFHHINNYTDKPRDKKIVVMAENITDQPISIQLLDKIIKGPSVDTLYVGQLLLHQYFRGNGYVNYTLQPGQKMLLINTEDKNWDTKMLLAGQMDLVTSGKVKFTVASADKGMTTAQVSKLPYLETGVHPRGTFDTTQLYYEVTATAGKPTYFIIGSGSEEWITGRDAIKNIPVLNIGNYGIVYHIKIKAEEDMGIILNPRGGPFRGSVRIDGKYTYMIPNKSYLPGNGIKASVVSVIKKGEIMEIEYSLPNASSSPILFGMIPKSCWK